MPEIRDVCRYVRSKNAGPFWITIDLFFRDRTDFDLYSKSSQLSAEVFGDLYGVSADLVSHYPVEALNMLKVSFPRAHAQGWQGERDMHGGQFFARLMDVNVEPVK